MRALVARYARISIAGSNLATSRLNGRAPVSRSRILATEKQIAANRANARRSTGPKTAAGKRRSSRNAYRHGLSGLMPPEDKINSIGREPTGELASENQLTSAEDLARTQAELIRIRSIRMEQLAKVDLNDCTLEELKRLAALDRYERYALTKRRRASQALRSKR